jgi:FAD/FMN-containing dehydrogenases
VLSQVRDAIASKQAIRVSGGGSWMNAGRPVQAAQQISVASDKGIVDYVPDDLTMTVRAGTTLSEISAATRANGQWLPLDPFRGTNGTIGAIIATASSGPLSHSSGTVRDFILGLEIVTGKGDAIRSGGRVVKNVAGFDLMRLNCGAWGTLGVITQASLRLYSLPKVDRTFALSVPSDGTATLKLLESLRTAPLAALAMEGISPFISSSIGLPSQHAVLVRLAGNQKLVDAQLDTLGKIGKPTEIESHVWSQLTEMDIASFDTVIRISGLPTNIGPTWEAGHSLLEVAESGFVHATFSRGSVRVALKGLRGDAKLPRSTPSMRVTYDVLPSGKWQRLSPTVTSDRLSQSVKRAFDPDGMLNPGILG